jgi:hypothetical protein
MSNLKDRLSQKVEIIQANNSATHNYINDIVKEVPDNVIALSQEHKNQAVSIIPDFVVSLELAKERISMLQSFVREMMIANVDYGLIPNCQKPSLFKSGAEKLTDIFGFSKKFEITNRIEDWDKIIFHYEVKCILINKRTGLIEAEGLGSCNNRERKYKNQDGFSIINTILKMGKKRALVDAVLSATRSSGIFTQDIEDAYEQPSGLSTRSTISPQINTNTQPSDKSVTKAQQNKIISIITQRKLPIHEMKVIMNDRYKVTESKYLKTTQADDFIEFLQLYNAM